MNNQNQETYDIMEVCLLAGKVMLQSGAETYRVEDTMTRIASAFGVRESHSFVTPTVIIFSIEGLDPTKTKLVRVSDRTTDLHKVTLVNSVSRTVTSGQLSLEQAYRSLKEIETTNYTFPLTLQIVAAALIGGCFLIMLNGEWRDFLPACIGGGVGLFLVIYFHKLVPIKFFAEFSASVVVGLISLLFVKIGLGYELDKIIIGSLMPLVPGLLLTNAVRDLMAGHLMSGIAKGAEAFLTAFAIGSGIAVVFILF
ncbi:threonine/serine exporter family protein [Bacillus solimangrovi]|uniref:Threonine/serine exporter-like N-terminal domain-containing protein n=1 Tax=Bacillus solimangrovi TaxID=1305675 RepID=A0A1E5LFB2_9BACI|nr:threonine/serine exporter family protein [Bacillus solimangrovi]OEH92775.1 hypothetical protein BFG57_01910 [Bacillus solimangrovi]